MVKVGRYRVIEIKPLGNNSRYICRVVCALEGTRLSLWKGYIQATDELAAYQRVKELFGTRNWVEDHGLEYYELEDIRCRTYTDWCVSAGK